LLAGDDAQFTIYPHLHRDSSVDFERDFVPVSSLSENTLLLAVSPSLALGDLGSFLDFAKRATRPIAYASNGNGSQPQLAMERLRDLADLNLLHIPYKTGTQAATAAIAGEVVVLFGSSTVSALATAGKLRVIASTGEARSRSFPGVPTLDEHFPGFTVANWQGWFSPRGTPSDVLARLSRELGKITASSDMRDWLAGQGDSRPLNLTLAQFEERIRRDRDTYRALIKQVGLKID
jgi:tripartite-type tricarboxylate transporter receptor subunit TctC